jgi:hypothetical protein
MPALTEKRLVFITFFSLPRDSLLAIESADPGHCVSALSDGHHGRGDK